MSFNPVRKIKKLVERSFFYRRSAEKFLSSKSFEVEGRAYPYTIHPHNFTWTNERAVEISIAEKAIADRPKMRTLEVGNVTQHYFQTKHDVVDKYEKADGVINVDVVDYSPRKKVPIHHCYFDLGARRLGPGQKGTRKDCACGRKAETAT